MQGHLQSLANA